MAACGCADGHIEQLLISERLVLPVSCPSYCRLCDQINVRFWAELTFAEKASSAQLGQGPAFFMSASPEISLRLA